MVEETWKRTSKLNLFYANNDYERGIEKERGDNDAV
jgi:hypothetical protein